MFKFPHKMNLECLNNIITSNLAIHIDLTDLKSWDLNTGLTSFSLTKWSGAVVDNINLKDFGLTAFDNGRADIMWSGITITPQDNLFSMFRVGYNEVLNPTPLEYSGILSETTFLPMSAVTTGTSGNYFDLNGGYLQGFFKLKDYNYELLPSRYNDGITIETLLYLYPNSCGIFYMMGARAEDKYNPYFSGETTTGTTMIGVRTSVNNFLNGFVEKEELKSAFSQPEYNTKTVLNEVSAIKNIRNNVIAFELTSDKKLAYKYINADGLVVTNTSNTQITTTGFTLITIAFTPNERINDLDLLECKPQRLGKLILYVNGRAVWIIKEFPEFYFKSFSNDGEKQIGVPYSISWGGGSFGLKESWHYDYQTYILYGGNDSTYINTNFSVQDNPIESDCHVPVGDINGLSLSADNTTFTYPDACDATIEHPITVIRVEYTGGTGNTYFMKFNSPISVISNRDYVIETSILTRGFFTPYIQNQIKLIVYGDDFEVNVKEEMIYIHNDNCWTNVKTTFTTPDNSGQKFVNVGLLIEAHESFITGGTLYIDDIKYTAADILVKDDRKNNLTIEQNFNNSFIGGIQKLRIYDKAFNASEVLHNAIMEARDNSNILVNKGGRIINR